MKRCISIVMGGLTILLLSLPTFAATAAPSDVFELGEIIVSAAQEKAPVVAAIAEVTAADIERTGAASVSDALSGVPGIWTTVGGKNVTYVGIRGMIQSKVLVLLDGVPLTSPYDGYLDLNQIPVDNVAKITVVKGVASPLYGSDAMAGVINIVTKKPKGEASGNLKVGLDEVGAHNESLSYYLPIRGRSLTISAGENKSDGFKMSGGFIPTNLTAEEGGRRLNSNFEKKNFGLKYGYEGTNPSYINFNYAKNNMGMMVNTTSAAVTGTLTRKISSYSRFTDWKSWTLDLSREQRISDTFKLRGKVYYHHFGNTVTQYTDGSFTTIANQGGAPFMSTYDDFDAGMRLLGDWAASKNHQLGFSINAVMDQHEKQPSPGLPWDKYISTTISLGAESNVKLSERLAFVTGVSYDTLEPRSNTWYTYPSNPTTPTVANATLNVRPNGGAKSALNPMFGFTVTPNANNAFHLTFGRKTRFPTLSELYGSNNGNPDLGPQKSDSIEAAYEYKYDCGYSISFTFFSNKVSGLIYSPVSTVTLSNISYSLFRGHEMGLKKTAGRLTGSLTSTFVKAKAKEGGSIYFLTNLPTRKLDVDLAYNFYKSYVFNLSSLSASTRYTSTTNTATIPDYTVLNAGLSGDMKRFSTKWRLYVNNINDRNYMEEDGYPQAGRTVRGEFDYSF